MAEGPVRPPSSVHLLLMECANLTNKTHHALKRPLTRRMKHEEIVYAHENQRAHACTPCPVSLSASTSLTFMVHHKPAHIRGSLGKHIAIN